MLWDGGLGMVSGREVKVVRGDGEGCEDGDG